jgi:hypothetical protein
MKSELFLSRRHSMNCEFQMKSRAAETNPWDRAPLFDANRIEQFRMNVYYFAELLFRWQMYYKRLELLNAVAKEDILPSRKAEPHRIGMS